MKAYFIIWFALLFVPNLSGQRSYFTINFSAPQVGQMIYMPIFFDLDGGRIRPDGLVFLDSITRKLFNIDSFSFTIECYTDCRSSKTFNADISQRRADSIVAYIKRKAIRKLEIKAIGMGESKPLNDCICEDKIKAYYTRYFEDTVNCVITPTVIEVFDSNTMQYKTVSYSEVSDKIKRSESFIPCKEHHHHINRRTILRITGKRRRY